MSVFRLFSPRGFSRSSSPSGSPSRHRQSSRKGLHEPRIEIHVPSYGSVFMSNPSGWSNEEHPPGETLPQVYPEAGPSTRRDDRESRGVITIELPVGMGRFRVKAVRVGMISQTELTLSKERVKEVDTIFERKVEMRGGNADGIILEEGIQRFDFTLIVPGNLCTHDVHANGNIRHTLYAELEGTPSSSQKSHSSSPPHRSPRSPSTPQSRSRLRTHSPFRSGSSTPLGEMDEGVNPSSLTNALSSMSITRQEEIPATPAYAANGNADEIPWLVGKVRKERWMEVLHNCDPGGGVNTLDVLARNDVDGLGPFEISMLSDAWTIGGLLFGILRLPAPSPAATIFSFRVLLSQTHDIQSPRDNPAKVPPTSTTQSWPIFTLGQRPPQNNMNPGLAFPALWRGTKAGGSDESEIVFEGRGRCPDDKKARPTSLPDLPTPITVHHKLVVEVLFSIWAEDEAGNRLDVDGPGRARAMTVQKGTTLASCAFTPEELRLPSYGSIPIHDTFSHLARKCPLCGLEPADKLCKTCPTAIPHPRHDHPPKLVGNDEGICPLCAEEVIPRRAPNWDDCACGMTTEYLEKRAKMGMQPPRPGEGPSGIGDSRARMGVKDEEEERGRRR